MILGKKVGQGDFTGVIPEAPAVWGYQSHCLTSSGVGDWTFTAPAKGWYRFHLVGPGGAGGSISTSGRYSEPNASGNSVSYPSTPGGGGAGGYAIHDVYLKAEEKITVTLNGSKVSAQFGETTVEATCGAVGNYTNRAGGKGGTASGGNVRNTAGATGGEGNPSETSSIHTWYEDSWETITGPSGGSGAYGYNITGVGRIGYGGDGAGSWRVQIKYSDGSWSSNNGTRPTPKAGGPGGVIVEAAAS